MMKNEFIYSIFILFASIAINTVSATENALMNHLTFRNGLSGESVFKVFKDHNGLIWLGTTDGLNCFNGVSIYSYRIKQEKKLNTVHDITETTDKHLYVATQGGLFKRNNKKDSLERVCPEINFCVSALASQNNTIYIGTEKGLFIYANNKVQQYLLDSNVFSKTNNIKDIFIDKQKRIWIATATELALFDNRSKSFKRFNSSNQIQLVGEFLCLSAVNNSVYLGTSNEGIIRFDLATQKFSRYISVGCNIIMELSTNGKDELYVATDGNGSHIISIAKNKIVQSYTTSSSPYTLSDNSTYCFYRDTTGINWFGLFRQGFAYTYYVSPIFSTYSYRKFTTEGINVRSFTINGKQKLIGTRKGFYFIDEQRNLVKYFSPEALGGSIVISNCFYHGKYYIATFDGGVRVFDPITFEIKPFGNSPIFRKGSFFYVTVHNDQLWFTANLGIFCYDGNANQIISYTNKNSGLLNGYCNNIKFDKNGKGWIGTQKGVCIFEPNSKTIQSSGFPEGFFSKESEVNFNLGLDGQVIGFCREGIYITKDDMSEFKTIHLSKKIFSEFCCFILPDKNRHYWIGTEKGLFYFDEKFQSYIQFGSMDNMRSLAFNTQACYLDTNNTIWLGSASGLIFANTSNIIQRHFYSKFPIIPNNIVINGERIERKKEMQSAYNHRIDLQWNITSEELSLQPIVLNYANPSNTYFEYRIDNGTWETTTSDELVECKGLLLGDHKLEFRMVGSPTNISSYILSVRPSIAAILESLGIFLLLGRIAWLIYRRKKDQILTNGALRRMKSVVSSSISDENNVDENILIPTEIKLKKNNKEAMEINKEKYIRVKMNDEEYEIIVKKLEVYLVKEKSFLNPNLKMSDIARAIDCSSNKLSQVFSLYLNQNYYDFIRECKINCVMKEKSINFAKQFKLCQKNLILKVSRTRPSIN